MHLFCGFYFRGSRSVCEKSRKICTQRKFSRYTVYNPFYTSWCAILLDDISTTVFSYSCAVQYHTILHGVGVIAQVLLHGPWGYAVSWQPRCALIIIDAFDQRVTWYFVSEETRCCSGMDNEHFITLVSMQYSDYCTVGLHFHSPTARENSMPTRAITRDIAC